MACSSFILAIVLAEDNPGYSLIPTSSVDLGIPKHSSAPTVVKMKRIKPVAADFKGLGIGYPILDNKRPKNTYRHKIIIIYCNSADCVILPSW